VVENDPNGRMRDVTGVDRGRTDPHTVAQARGSPLCVIQHQPPPPPPTRCLVTPCGKTLQKLSKVDVIPRQHNQPLLATSGDVGLCASAEKWPRVGMQRTVCNGRAAPHTTDLACQPQLIPHPPPLPKNRQRQNPAPRRRKFPLLLNSTSDCTEHQI